MNPDPISIGDRASQAFARLLEAEVIIQFHAWEEPDAWIAIADALACAPALAVSVVCDHAFAVEAVTTLVERTDGHVMVGMSQIETAWDVEAANAAGASFLLTSVRREEVRQRARALDLLYMPGVFTRAEVALAYEAGHHAQFLFPADIFGPEHVRELHDAFPEVHFFPGVNLTAPDLTALRRAGAAAAVVELPVLANPDWRQADIITFVRHLLRAWREG